MTSYKNILERKQEYYGETEASYEFAVEEYAMQFRNKIQDAISLLKQTTEFEVLGSFKLKVDELQNFIEETKT